MSAWIIETLVATTLLMLLVLAVRTPVSRLFGARAAYLLWLAPALRMLLPPLPHDLLKVTALPDAIPTVSEVAVVLAGSSSLPAGTMATPAGDTLLPLASLGVWLGGAALFFARHLLAYHRFAGQVRAEADPLYRQGSIAVAASRTVTSPVAFGLLSRAIIVPADFSHRFDETEQRLALSHETVHHRRGDLAVNMAALAMLALHWWNPIAHFAHRAFRLDQEAACDALVLANASGAERAAYGNALYKSATGGVPLVACAMGTTSQLKARLQRIVARREDSAAYGIGAALAVSLAAAGTLATASGAGLVSQAALAQPPAMIALGGVDIETPSGAARADVAPAASVPGLAAKPDRIRTMVRVSDPHAAETPHPPLAAPLPVVPTAPSAPLLPTPPEAAAGPDMPAATAPALAARCGGKAPIQLFARATSEDGAAHRAIAIVMCPQSARQQAAPRAPLNEALAALARARSDLATDPMLDATLRSHIVATIDRQIERLEGRDPGFAAFPAG